MLRIPMSMDVYLMLFAKHVNVLRLVKAKQVKHVKYIKKEFGIDFADTCTCIWMAFEIACFLV